MRKPHFWKRPKASSAPSNILVFDTETYYGKGTEYLGGELQRLRLGCLLAYRLERGRRTRELAVVFRSAEEFWAIVAKRLDAKRPLWLVAHNIPFDLGVVGGWAIITSGRCEWKTVVLTAGATFLKGQLDGKPIRIIDTCNWYHSSLESIGKMVGIPKGKMPDPNDGDWDWIEYCERDVKVTAAALDKLIATVRDDELGPFQPTAASLAFGAYRCRWMTHKVLVHSARPVLKLERDAYYGGRVDVNFAGQVPASPVFELDVCSMYPNVCRLNLPYQFEGFFDQLTVPHLGRLLERYMVIAEVRINTRRETFPVRRKSGTFYPVGEYVTTLADPELRFALESGLITGVYRAAWYKSAPIFRDYMNHWLKRKLACHEAGDTAGEAMAKLMLNSLYGKTGQRSHRWREWSEQTMRDIEHEFKLPAGYLDDAFTRPPVLYGPDGYCMLPGIDSPFGVRDLFGRLEISLPIGESRDSCPAIAACVTSYARVQLQRYQMAAGATNWFYADTDSIWCNGVGRDRLDRRGDIKPNTPGYLSEKGEHARLSVYGPKDYETDKVRRIKGVRMSAVQVDGGGWCQLHFPGATTQIRDGIQAGVYVRRQVKHLARTLKRIVVNSDGTTRPLHSPSELPQE